MSTREDALAYHAQGRPGKIAVVPTKPVASQRDLSLAYSPGVAEPCLAIAAEPDTVAKYTARSNLVAVITNGTAVLGLGDIGPLAAKPVMEGKGVLFKKFADIDVFDIELAEKDSDKLVEIICALEPTFGGINLEDIKAPECFVIERKLRERLKIPVFHDDQHGTAIICAAALKNAAALQQKRMPELKVVCLGAGAAAVACMDLFMRLGVRRENIWMADSKGIVVEGRGSLNEFKARFARPSNEKALTVADALVDADVFLGLATGNLVTGEMVKRMGPRPIILALANPDPEIPYEVAVAARPDAIVATGRSDYPNQVNNVLGFPYVFRGALDVGARCINEEMKLAAALALAELTQLGVPDRVQQAYGGGLLRFGPDYIIPKPFDQRVLYWVAPAVAKAAMDSGVAREKLDLEQYRESLRRKLSPTSKLMWSVNALAKREPKRIVFCEGAEPKILRAADILRQEGIAKPILLGRPERIEEAAARAGIKLSGMELVYPRLDPRVDEFAAAYHRLRERRGVTREQAIRTLAGRSTYFGLMMLRHGDADAVVSGLTHKYADTIVPTLEVIGVRPGVKRACGMHVAITDRTVKLLADTTLNIEPDAETLAEVAEHAVEAARHLGIDPRVAMLSFSTFGSAPAASSRKMAEATRLVKERLPGLNVDGEIGADIALSEPLRKAYPFSQLQGEANVLVFPNLDASNIAYKLMGAFGDADLIGPVLLGIAKPVAMLSPESSVDDIVHLTTIAVSRAVEGSLLAAAAQ
jgi:malate dehydrogenase (oxaloacetate-decarboxylating)(NADP+)